jgi:N-acetylglucosamine-6-phosphate deacetylase
MAQTSLIGNIITPFETIEKSQITIENGKITYIGEPLSFEGKVMDFSDCYIVPGLIDVHVHGALGRDIMDCSTKSIEILSNHLAGGGVTGFLATTYSAPQEQLLETLKIIQLAHVNGAKLLGAHLEGPFINKNTRGAQNLSSIREPNLDEIQRILEAFDEIVKMITLAPETDGALNAIRFLDGRGIVISAGHTNATFNETIKAIDAGLNHASHLYNGMRGFHHREPGVVGATLTDDRVSVELIADGFHVHPAALKLAILTKGIAGIVLVSDCIKPAGLPDGEYMVGRSKVKLKGGYCTLEDGTIAGSTIRLNQAIKYLVEEVGFKITEVLQMMTWNPAKLLGLKKKGQLMVDWDADLTVLDKDYAVKLTMVSGRNVYES